MILNRVRALDDCHCQRQHFVAGVPNGGEKTPESLELIAVKDEVDILEWMRMASALEWKKMDAEPVNMYIWTCIKLVARAWREQPRKRARVSVHT